MRYEPIKCSVTGTAIPSWIDSELRRLSQALAAPWPDLRLDQRNVSPVRYGDGYLLYADGTNYNPGDGKGIYANFSGTWSKLAATGTANNFTQRQTTTDGVTSGTARVIGGRCTAFVSATDSVTAVTSNNSFITFAQSYVMPANTLKTGSSIKITAIVVVTNPAGADTLTVEVRFGGTSLITTTPLKPSTTSDFHHIHYDLQSRDEPSAATSCFGAGFWDETKAGAESTGTGILLPTNFATNAAITIDVRAKWSSNTAGTACRLDLFNILIH